MLPFEQHSHSVEPKEVAALEGPGPIGHLGDTHSPSVSSTNERADARARDNGGLDAHLRERPEDADVREPLESTAAEDERYLVRLAPRLGGSCSFRASRSLAGHANVGCGKL